MLDERQEPKAEEGGEDKWMLSYGDMMTLLLTFFVLLFAMSSLDAPAMREMVISLRGTFGVLTGGERVFLPGDLPEPEPASGEPVASNQLIQPAPKEIKAGEAEGEAEATATSKEQAQGQQIKIIEREGEVIVRLTGIHFESNQFEFSKEDEKILDRVRELIDVYGYKDAGAHNEVIIAGHTDNNSVQTNALVRSNWHLSALRASQVVQYLVERGVPKNTLSIAAYGDTKPADPTDPENDEKNRRIDIIFRPLAERGTYPR